MSLTMCRTTGPGVGIGTVSIFSVRGSNATIRLVRASLYQTLPSVAMAMP